MKDYDEILGISKTATAEEIKRAYRKLALEFHPDRNKSQEADMKFKEATKAYEVLSDVQKRQTYDQFGASAFEQGGPGGQGPSGGNPFSGGGPFNYTYSTNAEGFDFGGFSDPFDIFEQFFGGASPFGRRQQRAVYSLSIDFMEAMKGVDKQVTITNKSQTIKIPVGVDTGSRIRFSEYDIVVEVRPDKRFTRDGSDIVTEHDVAFSDAALGTELTVETIEGNVTIKIPSGTQPNTVIRLKSKGVPHLRGNGKGDHYVRIKITVPVHLNNKQKELLRQFAEEGKGKKGWF